MPYVQRDASGAICGLFANLQDFTQEFLPDTDPAVIAFLNPPVIQTVLAQDLMAQFTPDDVTAIQTAIGGNALTQVLQDEQRYDR